MHTYHAILSGFGYGLATNLESCHPFGISSLNHPQMRVLKCVFVLQAIAEDTVKAGVTEEERPCEHQPGDGEQGAQGIKRNRKPFVVDQVIGPRAEAGICQIAEHAQVRRKK